MSELLDLVRRVCGRASVEGADSFSVPVPNGTAEDAAYRELRALLQTWELRHPGVKTRIASGPPR